MFYKLLFLFENKNLNAMLSKIVVQKSPMYNFVSYVHDVRTSTYIKCIYLVFVYTVTMIHSHIYYNQSNLNETKYANSISA